jgi:hypothetical protein
LEIEPAMPHGHVAAVLGMVRKIALDRTGAGAPEARDQRQVIARRMISAQSRRRKLSTSLATRWTFASALFQPRLP